MPQGFDKLLDAIGDTLKTAPTLYEDALQPAVQEVGKFTARVPRAINAAFSGLDKWILNKEYNVEETKKLLEQNLKNIDPEKIVTPDAYVAVPAIQAISYSMNSKELRNLYANLLSKSMNIDTKDSVHPAYIETIKQLSPDDAVYFKHLCQLEVRPMIDVKLDFPHSLQTTIAKNNNLFSENYVKNFPLAIDNLSRLGLINIPVGIWYGTDSLYEPLIAVLKLQFSLDKCKPSYPSAIGVFFDKKRIDITEYGNNFYKVCVL